MQRFGAFYMDYLYTMENSSGKGIVQFISPHRVCLLTLPPPLFLYMCHVLHGSARCFLPIYFVLSLTSHFVPPILLSLSNKPPGDLKKEPVLFESQPPGPWPFLSSRSTQTYLEGNCHSVFSLCWHVFEFLSPRCLLKHCFPLSLYL